MRCGALLLHAEAVLEVLFLVFLIRSALRLGRVEYSLRLPLWRVSSFPSVVVFHVQSPLRRFCCAEARQMPCCSQAPSFATFLWLGRTLGPFHLHFVSFVYIVHLHV